MGIEPLLCLLIPVIGFLLQAFIALRDGIRRRRRRGLRRVQELERQAAERGWQALEPGRWVGALGNHRVVLDARRVRTDLQRREIEDLAGERFPAGRWTPLGVHSVLLRVELPTRVPGLRLAHCSAALPHRPCGDVIADLALCQRAQDPEALRRWLTPQRREAVLDFLGTQPYSLVLEDHLVLWLHDTDDDLEELFARLHPVLEALAPATQQAPRRTASPQGEKPGLERPVQASRFASRATQVAMSAGKGR